MVYLTAWSEADKKTAKEMWLKGHMICCGKLVYKSNYCKDHYEKNWITPKPLTNYAPLNR